MHIPSSAYKQYPIVLYTVLQSSYVQSPIVPIYRPLQFPSIFLNSSCIQPSAIPIYSLLQYLCTVSLSQCSVAVKRHHDLSTSYKRKHLIGGSLTASCRRLVQCQHSRENGGMQVGTILENYLRALILDPQAAGRDTGSGMGF